MAKISAPKGTFDLLPADTGRWQEIERIARELAAVYHFGEIRTPIFEETELFHRGVGETSDIVSKEMYTFEDRAGRSITLRPEGTAGVVRAAIENGLIADEAARAKVYYIGPNFRYEKPQAGRYRQHHQFGVEAFGIAAPEQDVECILLQMDFYQRCGLRDLELRINSLGDRDSKQRYRDALKAFLEPQRSQLSEESQRRLDLNPLRILDSKDPRDHQACVGVPAGVQYLSEKSRRHLEILKELLDEAGVKYRVDPQLVRGFDYYSETLWEVIAGGLGAQNAVGGGGRYDNLVEQLGGRPTPGVGFGSGIERLLLALEGQGISLPRRDLKLIWIAYHGEAARREAWRLLRTLRTAGFSADTDPSGRSVKAQFKAASRAGSAYCVTIGENELNTGTVELKDLATTQQTTVPRNELIGRLQQSGAGPRGA